MSVLGRIDTILPTIHAMRTHIHGLPVLLITPPLFRALFFLLSSYHESMIESRSEVHGMHLEDTSEVMGIGFCGVIGSVDCVNVTWYEMFCAERRSARGRGTAYRRGITGGMVKVRDGARVGEEECITAQAGGDGGSNGGRKPIVKISERVSRPFDDGVLEGEQTCTCP